MATSLKGPGSGAYKALEPVIEPVLEYGHAMRAWGNSTALAARIVSEKIDFGFLSRFLISAIVISALVGKLVPSASDSDLAFFGLPIIDDAIGVAVLMIAGVLNALVVFWPIRWVGGTGSLRHTVIAGIYTAGALYPIVTLLSGLWWQIGGAELPNSVSAAGIYYLVRVAADIHRVSFRRAFVASIAPIVLVFALAVAVTLFLSR
jgi:hypothetical protein